MAWSTFGGQRLSWNPRVKCLVSVTDSFDAFPPNKPLRRVAEKQKANHLGESKNDKIGREPSRFRLNLLLLHHQHFLMFSDMKWKL